MKKLLHLKSLLIITALALEMIYLLNSRYTGDLVWHEEVAYNVAQHNSVKINRERLHYVWHLINAKADMNATSKNFGSLPVVEYADIDAEKFGPGTQYRTVTDTVGYGVLLGLLWKITGSYRYIDMMVLQFFMYLLMLFFIYQIVFMLFKDERFAYFSCFMHLTFLPLLAQNFKLLRADIWGYYGSVIILYCAVSVFYNKQFSLLKLISAGIFFAFCMHMRSSVFVTLLVVLSTVAFSAFYFKRYSLPFKMIFVFVLTNIVFFWIPFVSYNQKVFGRWFVSPSGVWLLEGIGQWPNPWGYKLCDKSYGDLMREKYGFDDISVHTEDKGRELFWQAVKERPGLVIGGMIRRIPELIFPYLPWINTMMIPAYYKQEGLSWKAKIQMMITKPSLPFILNTFFHLWFRYIFMLICYFGMVCMIVDKRWFAFFLLGSALFSGYHFIFSHVEPRYVIPFYWPCSIFVAYAVNKAVQFFSRRKEKRSRNSLVHKSSEFFSV